MTDQEENAIHRLRDDVRDWFGHVHIALAELRAEVRETGGRLEERIDAHDKLDAKLFEGIHSDIRGLKAADDTARHRALTNIEDKAKSSRDWLRFVLGAVVALATGVVGTLIAQGI